ncbi:MAG: Crp/Fnr family transcriptional regulator [Bacillota bacterium]|nr:Crp/Fnr family transcriptional regulator [Bacillota bacterium]
MDMLNTPDYYNLMFSFIEKMSGIKISEAEKRSAVEIFKPVKLAKKEFFLREGEIPDRLGFNVSGALRCYYIDRKGNDITKFFSFEGSVCSYAGLLLKKESKYYIEALEDCVLMVADYDSFEKMIEDSSLWLKLVKKIQDQILIYKEERESSFLMETATERYNNFKKNYPEVEERINQSYIASYLGISAVSLSRIRNKLKNS